jgi:uncharacterized protein YqeY
MRDAAEWFRARLSEKVRAAMAERDLATLRTLRCMMAVIDNAGAISQEEVARLTAASITEAPRKHLTEQELAELLQTEIDARARAADAYERVGNVAQATLLREEIATIEHLTTLLR